MMSTTGTTTTTIETKAEETIVNLAGKSDRELLLMIREQVQKIKEIVKGLKTEADTTTAPTPIPTPTTITAPTTVDTPNAPTPTVTSTTSADLAS